MNIKIEKLLENRSLLNIEKNMIYYYLKSHNIDYSKQIIITKFLSNFEPSEDLSILFSNYENILELSKEFEFLISAYDKKENGAFYTPPYVVDKMIEINNINESSIILEPSVGGGIFIFEILNFFKTSFNKKVKNTLKENIYMNDIDISAIDRIYLLISVYALENNEIIKESDFNISNFDFLSNEFNIFYKDIKFDIIIGNPPYLSLEKGFLKETIDLYKKEFKSIYKVYDIFGIFIEKSIKFLNKDGQLSFIVPSTLFTNDSFEKLRTLMLKYNIEYCINLGDGVFENAVVPSCIFKLTNNKNQKNINLVHDKKEYSLKIYEILGDKNSFRLGIDYEFNKEIMKYKNNSKNITLDCLLDIKEAIKTGDDKSFITDINYFGLKPLVKGRDIKPFEIKQKLYLKYDKDKLSRPLNESFFEQNKIFIRRVSNKIIAAFDNNNLYATHTLYCAFDINNHLNESDFKILEILLNSDFYTLMYLTLFPLKGNIFPEIRTTKLNQLIFPNLEILRKNNEKILSTVTKNKINQKLLTNIIKNML